MRRNTAYYKTLLRSTKAGLCPTLNKLELRITQREDLRLGFQIIKEIRNYDLDLVKWGRRNKCSLQLLYGNYFLTSYIYFYDNVSGIIHVIKNFIKLILFIKVFYKHLKQINACKGIEFYIRYIYVISFL